MRARSFLTLVLGAFIVVAVITTTRQASQSRSAAPDARSTSPATEPLPPQRTPDPPVTAAEPAATPAPAEPARVKPTAAASTETHAPAAAVQAALPKPAAPKAPEHRIVAMYFHGNVRCVTCRKVEAYAREALEAGFPSEIAAGLVEFRAVNVEDPVNRHFIQDFQLVTRSVVVTDEAGGAVQRFVKLDDVWGLVGNRTAYLAYVQDAVRGYLETR